MRFAICTLAIAASSVAASTFSTSNPYDAPVNTPTTMSQLESKSMTNGKRMARGLPPKPPVMRSSRAAAAARAQASQAPRTAGIVKVSKIVDGSAEPVELGFVSRALNAYGEMDIVDYEHKSDALLVNINVQAGSKRNVNIATTNGDNYMTPFFGAIAGYQYDEQNPASVLGPASANYVWIGSTTSTFRQSGPTVTSANSDTSASAAHSSRYEITANDNVDHAIESKIWRIDAATNVLTAQWLNPDAITNIPLTFLYDGVTLFGTGDRTKWDATLPELVFTFVPSV
ncbi:hypothetical protein C8J56DRAFT_121838 [Mycena floridula]|nr:hypothetical protein C8J56DRAFT_121838 [Mycena floridula]